RWKPRACSQDRDRPRPLATAYPAVPDSPCGEDAIKAPRVLNRRYDDQELENDPGGVDGTAGSQAVQQEEVDVHQERNYRGEAGRKAEEEGGPDRNLARDGKEGEGLIVLQDGVLEEGSERWGHGVPVQRAGD